MLSPRSPQWAGDCFLFWSSHNVYGCIHLTAKLKTISHLYTANRFSFPDTQCIESLHQSGHQPPESEKIQHHSETHLKCFCKNWDIFAITIMLPDGGEGLLHCLSLDNEIHTDLKMWGTRPPHPYFGRVEKLNPCRGEITSIPALYC